MKGRHTPAGQPRPEPDSTTRDDAGRGGLLKKLALWTGLALCIAFIAWVAWGFLQFDHDIDNPREGGFSGWQCDAGRDCGS
ncbi:hypothetical protein [Streptomyces chartreusis]|uniref:hypothetical protein n=1 Tax=Streptomyces chartreusis TaxID=1969 RepID=UPI002E18EE2F